MADSSEENRVAHRVAREWGLAAETVRVLLEVAQVRRFSAGSSILPQGSARTSVFIVLDGEVSVSVLVPNGRRVLCALHHPGAVFGFPMVDSDRPRWSAAEAFTEATVALVGRRQFERIIEGLEPTVVMRFFNKLLARQARFAMRLLHCMVLDLRGRLALTLLELADTFGVKDQSSVRIELPLTHEHLAEMVGASRERVSKAMAGLEGDGLIRYRRGSITLKDFAALRLASTPSQ